MWNFRVCGVPGRGALTRMIKSLMHLGPKEAVGRRGYVRYPYVRWLLAEHESGSRNCTDQIFALLALKVWPRTCVEGRPV